MLPADALANSSILAFSSALLTGPRRVTTPPAVMILTFLAVRLSALSFTTAWRIACVTLRSSGLFDCSPAVWVWPPRSRSFFLELSAPALASSAASAVTLRAAIAARERRDFAGRYFIGNVRLVHHETQ